MTKTMIYGSELAAKLAADAGMTKADAEKVVSTLFGKTLPNLFAAETSVCVKGFGTFDVKHVPAKTCRNPKTGQSIELEAHRTVHFKKGTSLKKI